MVGIWWRHSSNPWATVRFEYKCSTLRIFVRACVYLLQKQFKQSRHFWRQKATKLSLFSFWCSFVHKVYLERLAGRKRKSPLKVWDFCNLRAVYRAVAIIFQFTRSKWKSGLSWRKWCPHIRKRKKRKPHKRCDSAKSACRSVVFDSELVLGCHVNPSR